MTGHRSTQDGSLFASVWSEVVWAWKCFRPGGYGREAWLMICPHPAPHEAVERLRARVISGDWS